MLNIRAFSLGPTATHSARATIDHIVQQGGQQLYDHYIQGKMPAHARTITVDQIQTVVRPVHSCSHQTADTTMQKAKQAVSYKIEVPPERRSSVRVQTGVSSPPREEQKIQLSRANERGKKNNRLRQWKEIATKQPPRTRPNHCIKNQCAKVELNDEELAIWGEKCIKYDQQQARQQQQSRKEEERKRWAQHLESKFKTIQQQNKPVVFDDESGKLLDTTKIPTKQPQPLKAKAVILRYDYSKSKRQRNHKPSSKNVDNIRKVTTFVRSRDRTQDSQLTFSYNNNDQRQVSTIPLMELEEGVKISEDGGRRSIQRDTPRPQTSRPASNMTSRTFKSFTRERMSSSKGFRTISYSAQLRPKGGASRYLEGNRQVGSQMVRRSGHSILWSSRCGQKNHQITRDQDLITDYFDFDIPTE